MEYRTRSRLRILAALAAFTPLVLHRWTGAPAFAADPVWMVVSIGLVVAILCWACYDIVQGRG
ncbi:hypothetical protein [Halomarina rubra]|uniref:Uncharacterized protein n=1 Tax=Halomarina rubra TaxID=2071873 RepID=A0ABD6ARC6_9EURY|nr:hypothetical protein [Halomarina rubra]